MEKFVYLNELYDLYGELLTEKQKKYFEDYYFNNLSYGEISTKYGISRNAIFHQLQLIEKKLNNYEDKLKIISRDDKLRKLASKIEDKDLKEKIMNILDE